LKVAILGSGNGGCAMAADWSLHGHEVSLFDFEQFTTQLDAINNNGGIYVEGELEGFAELDYVGHSIEKAIEHAELIVLVGPAYSTQPFAEALKPHIKKGQHVIVCPGSTGGGLVVKKELNLAFDDDSIIIAETSTLPYATRNIEPGKVYIYNRLKGGLYIAALPMDKTAFMMEQFDQIYQAFEASDHYFQTMLQNANPVIHPAVSLLNAGRIDNPDVDFLFYEEGVTPSVGRLVEATDNERIKIGKTLGVNVLPDTLIGVRQGYMLEADYETGYSKAPGFKGVMAPPQLDNRYINEDVGYGLVFMKELADKLNLETPIIDSIINIASVVMKRDFWGEKRRSLALLGLEGLTAEELFERFKA